VPSLGRVYYFGNSMDFKISYIGTLLRVLNFSIAFLLGVGTALALTSETSASEHSTPLNLTEQEAAWLSKNPVVRLTPDPLFPPYEFFDEKGNYRGIGADFIALLEKKTGLKFKIIQVKDWEESIRRTKNRENDVWSVVTKSPERSEYMNFTKPYIESPAVMLVRTDNKRQITLDDLSGLKVAVSSGYAVLEYLKRKLPNLSLETVPDPLSGLKRLSFGSVDVMIVNVALASHLMEKSGISNLHLAGDVGFTYRWGLAARKDWPELSSILEKGLAKISVEERQAITRKWVALKSQPFSLSKTQIFLILGLLGLALIIGILIWNHSLKRQVRLKTIEVQEELSERKAAA